MTLTKETVITLLETNDKAVGRALIVLLGNQTADEQTAETVKYHNGMGFKPCDAYIGTQMAKYFERNGRLTERQAAYWRRRNVKGVMKIAAYTRQILEAAEAKAIAKADAADRVIEHIIE